MMSPLRVGSTFQAIESPSASVSIFSSGCSSIIVEGTIDYQKDREDDKKIWTTILVDKWEFAGKKGDNGGGGDNRSTQSSGNTSNRAQAPAETSSEISDEDIPF